MPTRPALRIAIVLTVLAVLAGAAVTGCAPPAAGPRHAETAGATVLPIAAVSTEIPTQSPTPAPARPRKPSAAPGTARPVSDLSRVRGAVAGAPRDPVSTARAWAVAAHSSSYHDPTPGTWTVRAAPFVTGAEQAAELVQRAGGGGATWTLITSSRCVMRLRQLTVGIPSDASGGPALRIVYLTGLTALSCATGQVQLAPFAAQLTVTRQRGRWLVAAVTH